jgi:ABC-2 type transport system permease protein
VVGTFVRLKLRLLRNGLGIGQGAVLFGVGAFGASLLGLAGFLTLAVARTDPTGPDLAIVVFGVATLGWTIFPILGYGNDETLDPQRLATLPLSRRQLVAGVLAASLVGVAPLATLLAFSGALIGFAHNILSALMIAIAVAGSLLLCVVASRTLVSVLVPILRSRRGRDFTILALTLIGLTPPLLEMFAARGAGNHDFHREFVRTAHRVRLTPFAWGGTAVADAARGHYAAAAGLLVAMGGLVAGLLWLWSHALERALTSSDAPAAATRPSRRGPAAGLIPKVLSFLPRSRIGAVAAKDVRYFARDPRRRAPLIGALIVPAVALFASLSQGPARPGATTLLALVAVLPAAGLTLNQFGLDGAALWSTIAAGNDPRADLIGKNIASLLVMVPLATASAFVCAAFTGGWGYLPLTLGLAPAIFGVLLGVGDVMSVKVPYAMPDRKNPLAFNPGQGCATLLAGFAALGVEFVLLIPIGLVALALINTQSLAVATIGIVVVANAYGAAIWVLGRNYAARDVWWRLPELLTAVSPRQAG